MGDDNHTPGPWYVDSFLGSDSYEDPDMPFVEIGDVKWSPNRTSVPAALQQYTDAYLIAAAPDLLKALEDLIQSSVTSASVPKMNQAKRAIAKAKGEEE